MNTDQNDFAYLPEDQTAFRAFYHAAVQYLFPHALRFTRNTEEAKELCQKTIVRAYLRRRTFRPERGTSVFGWLWTVMKNLAATDRVCRTRSGEVTVQFATEHPLVWREAEQDAESRFIRAERASEVRAALAALPESFRDTTVRHYFGGETCEQIAAVLCVSINTVLTRLFRGRRKLRVLLTTHPDPAPKRGVLFYAGLTVFTRCFILPPSLRWRPAMPAKVSAYNWRGYEFQSNNNFLQNSRSVR
jgi:RNA polymerase sigma-70 factor (ECF subfamily)